LRAPPSSLFGRKGCNLLKSPLLKGKNPNSVFEKGQGPEPKKFESSGLLFLLGPVLLFWKRKKAFARAALFKEGATQTSSSSFFYRKRALFLRKGQNIFK